MNKNIAKKELPNLTAIRFFLASLVVIFHVAQFSKNWDIPYFDSAPVFHKGMEAVYMFFALSGFLIIKQLYLEKKWTATINLKSFYKRRALRIFPLYYLILIFGLLYYQVFLPYLGFPVENNYNLWSGIALSFTFFSNVFKTFEPGGILEILWSIGIEEQFYLFIAPLLFLLPFKRITAFLLSFSILYLALFSSNFIPELKAYDMLFFYFSFSGLCSIMIKNKLIHSFFIKSRFAIYGIAILYFVTNVFTQYLDENYYHLFSMILFGFLVTTLSLKPISLLSNKGLHYLGKISYGIYMYHAIVMQLVGFLFLKYLSPLELPNLASIIIVNLSILLITIFIAHLSYKYFESYFLKFKKTRRIELS